MSVAYLIEFTVMDDQRERFLQLISDVLTAMAQEANYRSAMLHEDPNDPRHFLLHEVWADHEDVMHVQMHRPYRREWHAALPDLLDGERRIEVWRPVVASSSASEIV